MRRGISLLEVLISMFVLLFGLMGVAAIFPVGNHFAGKGEQYDRGAALSHQAFADLKTRGMLNTWTWLYAERAQPPSNLSLRDDWHVIQSSGLAVGMFNVHPLGTVGPGHAFVIDPIGAAGAAHYRFPMNAPVASPEAWKNPIAYRVGVASGRPKLYGTEWPIRCVTFADPTGVKISERVAEHVFRMHDDLVSSEPEEDDRPGVQLWASDSNGTPDNKTDDVPLVRQYGGNYSWIATVSPNTNKPITGTSPHGPAAAMQPADSMYGSAANDVSVAVIYKRVIEDEAVLEAEINAGNELVIYGTEDELDKSLDKMQSGSFIAVAGVHPSTAHFILNWYKLLSLDSENDVTGPRPLRRATLEGVDWPIDAERPAATRYPIADLRAIVIPGVIGVSTQQLPAERQ